MTEPTANWIDAAPTKEFFISMLTRDIPLDGAITDLVDNSVDGARRLRTDGDFAGLSVRIELNPTRFRISDNCGGIPIDTARRYAFRFGRPREMAPTKHSVGQFGVGLKRAVFKMGSKFEVVSKTASSSFSVDVDVREWTNVPEWNFEFADWEEEGSVRYEVDDTGTTITVESLHEGVSQQFGLDSFLNRLQKDLASAHADSITHGLAVSVNQVPLTANPSELLSAQDLEPVYLKERFSSPDQVPIDVKLYAGIATSDPRAAGWYVYCNGRLVLDADQTYTTGWGDGIPKYHNQFARFRGFVFFDSDDAALLPWNTTKTDLDKDSPVFQSMRLKMLESARPIIDFLNHLDSERTSESAEAPLTRLVETAQPTLLDAVGLKRTFEVPQRARASSGRERSVRIQYDKPDWQVDEVKEKLNVTTFKDVGQMTFDYYYEAECEDGA